LHVGISFSVWLLWNVGIYLFMRFLVILWLFCVIVMCNEIEIGIDNILICSNGAVAFRVGFCCTATS
jgi:hypothetical protein